MPRPFMLMYRVQLAYSIIVTLMVSRNVRCGRSMKSAFALYQAPTLSIPGMKPSFKLLSSLLISSADVAFAMASRTRCASSFDIKRPALPGATTGLGSSVVTAAFVCADTVDDMVVASCVGRLSAVRKSVFPDCRSCENRWVINA